MDLVEFLRARLDQEEESLDAIDHVQAPAGHMTRARREVESKREIVDHHRQDDELCAVCDSAGPAAQGWPCLTLRLLAFPYADHPDYDEAWRPQSTNLV